MTRVIQAVRRIAKRTMATWLVKNKGKFVSDPDNFSMAGLGLGE